MMKKKFALYEDCDLSHPPPIPKYSNAAKPKSKKKKEKVKESSRYME